ncbi:hypothetical protein LY78DRAFT_708997, partial [Colletotrichum sublineola]
EVPARRGRRASLRQVITKRLLKNLDTNSKEPEHIPPFVTPLWWQGPHIYIIKGNTNVIHIYTDGSGINS